MTQMRQLNALTPTPSSERLAAEHSAEEMPSGWRGYEAALAGMGSVLSPDDVIHLALSTGTIGNDIAWIALARGLKVGALHANLLSTQMQSQSQKKIEHDAESNSTEEHESTAHSSLLGQRCLTGEISIAPGAALACLLQRKRQVIVTLLNKKISRSGAFFEALQMSLDWEVPVLFVALHEPADSKAATQGRTWVSRAESFGLKAARCDGLCVLDVRDKTREALEWVRTHKMPFLLELTIPNTAREPNAPNDPVALFRTRLLEAGVMRDEPPLTANS
jgi:TPP-dependent pyruvate/acetoin dehydrogenase alpha subunit